MDLGQACVVGASALLSESPLPLGRRKDKKRRQLSNKDVDVDMKDCFEVDTDVLMEDSSPVVHTDVLMEDVSVVDSSVKREVPSSSTLTTPSISSGSLPVPNPAKFYNLAVAKGCISINLQASPLDGGAKGTCSLVCHKVDSRH